MDGAIYRAVNSIQQSAKTIRVAGSPPESPVFCCTAVAVSAEAEGLPSLLLLAAIAVAVTAEAAAITTH